MTDKVPMITPIRLGDEAEAEGVTVHMTKPKTVITRVGANVVKHDALTVMIVDEGAEQAVVLQSVHEVHLMIGALRLALSEMQSTAEPAE